MSRVLRKISALNSMRNDWMMFAGRMRKSSRSVRQARPCSVMMFFFVRKMPMANSSIICACRLSMVENSGTDIPLSFERPLLMNFR